MSEKKGGESKKVDNRRGKRVQCSSLAGLQRSIRIRSLNSHSFINKLDLPTEQIALRAIQQSHQLEHNNNLSNNLSQLSTSPRMICSERCLTGQQISSSCSTSSEINYTFPNVNITTNISNQVPHEQTLETTVQSSHGNESQKRKYLFPLDLGKPDQTCRYCGAFFWLAERNLKTSIKNPQYNLCCREGRVMIPSLKEPPFFLQTLLEPSQNHASTHFKDNIRAYNSIFAFTSMGVNIDNKINDGHGPYVFRVSGQNYHRIGSLLPSEGCKPTYAQLYIYDTSNEIKNRLHNFQSEEKSHKLNSENVSGLMTMLNENNVIVQRFRMFKDRFVESDMQNFSLRLTSSRSSKFSQYCMPQANEVVGLVVEDINAKDNYCDVIVDHRKNRLQRIHANHPSYMALQYPLLFIYGEDGYHPKIEYVPPFAQQSKIARKYVTMAEFYAYRFHPRIGDSLTIFKSGRLFQQILVDAYLSVELDRLSYIQKNQELFRSENFSNIENAIKEGHKIGKHIGKRIILPASHVGSPRYMLQNYHDAMAICRELGMPDLFITFTCNPQWQEIYQMLLPDQKPDERPDIVARVFKMKLDRLLQDIKDNRHFGEIIAYVYTVEFQKRGLPHVHMILWIADHNKLKTTQDIDRFISAEIPNPSKDPSGYDAVTKFMIHGPCSGSASQTGCIKNELCSKKFPKSYNEKTTITEDGIVTYRRRETDFYIERKGVKLDNRFVVPHNIDLIVRYQAHINVEKCHTSKLIKYLFKYICKGNDRAIAELSNSLKSSTNKQNQTQDVNEIKIYLDCRYITPHEAVWRLFQYDIHCNIPSIERLHIHLPKMNNVIFTDSQDIENMMTSNQLDRTMLTEWMELNKRDPEARKLTYTEIPRKYTGQRKEKFWSLRKKGNRIGRIYFVNPNQGEMYYLRMLLNLNHGATTFEDIQTINNIKYNTFRDACNALGLLEDDNEWLLALQEASNWATETQLRRLFMASETEITLLKSLKADIFRPTIKGRIVKLWTAQNPKDKTVFSYDFILVDQQNTSIEGYISIKDPDANELVEKLEEGHIYKFYKFNPMKERLNFRTVEHPNNIRIQLTGVTDITKVQDDDASFPIHYFNFKQLNDIGTVITKDKSVVDLIGQITSARLKKIGTTNVVDMEIENERNDKRIISIWEDCLPQINFEKIEHESKTQHVVLAFSSIQIQEFIDRYSSKIYSLKSYSATRIYQDKSIPEIQDFLSRIVQKKIQLIKNPAPALQLEPNKTGPTYVYIEDLHHLCTANNEHTLFNVVAEIVEVLDEHGWYYLSCPTHRNRVTPTNTSFYCLRCDADLEHPLPWLNFCIRVEDITGQANFVFIGKMAEKLVGNSAQELLAHQTKKRELPPKFNDLRKKKKLFTVTWGQNKFKSALPNYQVREIGPAPATYHTPMEIEESKPHPGTPPDEYQKNSSKEELNTTTTGEKRKAKQLFLEQPPKKPRTSTESSKGKSKLK